VSRDGLIYAAACDGIIVADAATGAVSSLTWLTEQAPAKGIALVGPVAFVAAGRYGALAVDVSDPGAPQVIGNCTIADDRSFSASGVRAEGDRLYVAGGEWGVLAIDVSDPLMACPDKQRPALDDVGADPAECSSEPPWEVIPWRDRYTPPPPPPPGKDPIQTLPAGELLYAFGDARRIGVRAVEVRSTASFALDHVGRYDEPRKLVALAAAGGRVIALGAAGGLFARDEAGLLAPVESDAPVHGGIAATFLADGRWAIATPEGELAIEAVAEPSWLGGEVWPHGLAARGDELMIPLGDRVVRVGGDGGRRGEIGLGRAAALPPALLAPAQGTGLVIAAPEWVAAARLDDGAGAAELTPHDVFDEDEILDPGRWQRDVPRRLLVDGPRGPIEIAGFAGRAGLIAHDPVAPIRLELPAGAYRAAAAAGGLVYALAADRGSYRSQLVTIAIADGAAEVIGVTAFSGVAVDLAIDGDRLYVADADRGIRVMALADGEGEPIELGVIELAEVRP
jgi:hypothetical protein